MYISELYIDHLKLLRNFKLSFLDQSGSPRMWTVLVGENGRCKTSILRAIALAASGHARANQLADLAGLPDKRELDAPLAVRAKFALPSHDSRVFPDEPVGSAPPAGLSSELTMPAGVNSVRGTSGYIDADGTDRTLPNDTGGIADPLFEIRGRNLPFWFVAGYGTTRVLPAAGSTEKITDASVARMRSLFDRGSLTGTGFADLLEDSKGFSMLLRDALIRGGILPAEATGLELRGRGGIRSSKDLVEGSRFSMVSGDAEMSVPATWLSQGYQSTISWIADLLGYILLEFDAEGTDVNLHEIQGLVLIDEIDLHLHPRWQVRLISSLKEVFPKVQFVVTTHSPMVLPALRSEEIVLLHLDNAGNVVPSPPETSPMLLTGTEIYSEFFGIDELHPANLALDRQRYAFLVGNALRTDEEEAECIELRKKFVQLGIDPGWKPVPRTSP